jgi:hypothetical protein
MWGNASEWGLDRMNGEEDRANGDKEKYET